MSEFFGISTLDQQFLCFLVVLIVGAVAFGLWGYRYGKSSYELGYSSGKADLNREILRAENKAFVNGYEKAKKELARSQPKTPAKQPAKPSNKRRAQSVHNKTKPAPKKPVSKVAKGK